MSTPRLRILLLADDQKGHPNTIHDHIRSFQRYSRHDVRLFNPRNLARSRFLDLDAFDVVVVHYSIVVIWDTYLSPWFRDRLATFDGLKVQFLQDEYRWVDEITAMSRQLGVDVLFSVVPTETVDEIYGARLPDTEVVFSLTGYVPEELSGITIEPLATRPVDVGYRGRSTPIWLGRLGFEKIEIGRGFLPHAQRRGLRADIAWTENARIYGDAWNRWVASCRTMLASESGSSIVDFDRSIETAVQAYLADHPAAPYEEVECEVLDRFPPSPVINTLSPRLFESAAMRTGMIMFPGEYSGAVRPWEHYIPIEKDFSNADEVIDRIGDAASLAELTERAHADLIASGRYSYRSFVAGFDDVVEARAQHRPGRPSPAPKAALRLEEMSTGRGYHVSRLYGLGRELLLAGFGARYGLPRPALRGLARLAARSRREAGLSLWDDLFRIAILDGVQHGTLVPVSERFVVVPAFDEADGRLTFTSVPPGAERTVGDGALAALRDGRVRELVWNHAAFGQYVVLGLPVTSKRLAFDVGRYDAFGVYRFERLAQVATTHRELVVQALEPLLVPSGA